MSQRPTPEQIQAFLQSGIFDAQWYSINYPDAALMGMDPVEHYLWLGQRLGRKPSAEAPAPVSLPAPAWPPAQAAERVSDRRSPPPLRKKPSLSVPAESLRVRRRQDDWDTVKQTAITKALDEIIQANPGYFERVPVSVIMPTYNRAGTILRAIDSVRNQSYANWELLIIDDGSSDETADVVAPCVRDHRIQFHAMAHSGVSGARNAGLERARGRYVFYLDSDNIWDPDYLRYMVAFLETCGLSAAFCGIRSIDDAGQVLYYRGDHFDWQACLLQNYVDMNCFGHVHPGVGGHRFDIALPRLVDWDFILRITADSPTAFLPYCGVTYYDGDHGARISRVVARGEGVRRLEAAVRRKHPDTLFEQRQAAVLRPRIESAEDIPRDTLRGDDISRELLAREAALVDWIDLSARRLTQGLVSIVVLGYNNAAMSEDCLRSILKARTKQDVQIIFVDNASDDDTAQRIGALANQHDEVAYVSCESNLMFALGNNYGLKFAQGEFTVFLNNDTLVHDDWLDILIDGLRNDPSAGATGPKLLYPDGTLQCGGIAFNAKSKIPYHIYREFPGEAPEVNRARLFQALTGACLALRTRDAIALRGFDPVYVNGCEDLDLCFRLRERLGKRSIYLPRSKVMHLESKSKGRGRHIARNRRLFVEQWGASVRSDDTFFYLGDGHEIVRYEKPGSEPHGDTASYVPILQRAKEPEATKVVNVGFSTMWYARGIAFHTRQLAEALEAQGLRTHIFARWESSRFENGGAIHHPRVYDAGDDPSPDATVAWARRNAIDLMIFMEVHARDLPRVRALKDAGVTVMCYENPDVMRFAQIKDYALFDHFLFNCFHTREQILHLLPQARDLMIPWGAPRVAPAKLPAPDGPVEFVHVAGWGGHNNRKNTDLLVRAFDKVSAEGGRLHIHTQSPLAGYGADIVEICRKNPQIKVHEGTLPDIDLAYQDKSVLLWPSKREGVGLPILEALARALPVVISDGYMMKQWIVPGRHGWICPGKPRPGGFVLPEIEVDVEALTELIEALIMDPERIAAARTAILSDQSVWEWSWQALQFAEQIAAIAANPGYAPPADMGYVPAETLAFERRRRLGEAESQIP